MLKYSDLDPEQLDGIDFLLEHNENFLIASMGAGKSVVALSAMEELLEYSQFKRFLILAPKPVADTVWRKEHLEWEHLQDVNVRIAIDDDRDDIFFDLENIDVVVTNFENLKWMKEQDLFKYFDGLLVDESTKLKSHGTWFKSIRRALKHFKWRTVMTGTPVSENWEQLFYQMMIVDCGKTLGGDRMKFMKKYFYAEDFKGYKWKIHDHMPPILTALIAPYVYTMPDYRDSLPPLTIEVVPCPLPPQARRDYRDMANAMEAQGVLADTAAIKTMKLQQIANGFIYEAGKTRTVIPIHDAKMDMAKKLVKKIRKSVVEKFGKSVVGNIVIVYTFKEELTRLRDAFPDAVALGDYAASELVADWNSGKIPILCLNNKSGSHGLNLAAGGHTLILLSPIWSQDQYQQVMARLWRRGQRYPVTAYVLCGLDTVDDTVMMPRLRDKAEVMPLLLKHLNSLKRD